VLTDYHDVEVESFANTLAVPLVREIGKPNIAGQLSSNYILVVVDNETWRGCRFDVRDVERWRRN